MADAPASPPPASRTVWGLSPRPQRILILALLFLATVPLQTKIFTSDFGTHLAKGREIVRTHAIPQKEFLNYPLLGGPTDNAEWLFQAILYTVFSAGGTMGVSLFVWAIVFSIYLLIHRATVLRGGHPLLTIAAMFAFSGFLRIRIQPRPEIFTYLLIAATICIYTEYYFGKRRKLIWAIPPMVLFWANVHPTYLMFFLLTGAFFVDALARHAWRRELSWGMVRSWAFPPIAVGVAGLVLCAVNPQGLEPLLTPLHLISRGTVGSGVGSGVLMSISELTPVRGTGMFVYYKVAAVMMAVSLLLGAIGHRVYLLDLFLMAITFKGAWDSARAVSMMGLFLSPAVSLHMTGFLEKTWDRLGPRAVRPPPAPVRGKGGKKGRAEKERAEAPPPPVRAERWTGGRAAVVAVVVVALLAGGATTLSFSFSQLEYGVGITEHKFSFKAAEFLRENPVPGRMFNFFDIGGFLDWQLYPQALTYIDGRTNSGPLFMDHQVVTGGMPGWENVLRKYDVTYAVLKSMDSSGMILPIVGAMSESPEWRLVFSDGLFVVFVRLGPRTEGYIRAHEIPKERLPQHIAWEAYHYMFLGVAPVQAYQIMSNMYILMGNKPAAVEALRKALESYEDPYLRERLAQLERSPGLPFQRTPPPGR